MQSIHPGHEVLSLFGIAWQPQVLKKNDNYRLIVSLLSTFFVILAIGLVLGVMIRISSTYSLGSLVTTKAAFEPGQAVSLQLNRGYLIR